MADVGGTADSVTGLGRRERVRAFDLAAGLAVFFMILVHVLWHWGAPDTWTSPIGQVISFLGGPTAAPVFMFLMGASLAFSSRTSFRSLAIRGLHRSVAAAASSSAYQRDAGRPAIAATVVAAPITPARWIDGPPPASGT